MKPKGSFYSFGCVVAGLLALGASAQAAPPEAKPKGDSSSVQMPGRHGKEKGRPGESALPSGMPEHRAGEHRARPAASFHPAREGDVGERSERRKHRLKELRGRWGEGNLKQPACQEELRHHAWRLARLKRMRELATERKNTKQLAKLDALEKKEQARHERAMAKHQHGGVAPSASGAPAPSVAASAAVKGGTP